MVLTTAMSRIRILSVKAAIVVYLTPAGSGPGITELND